MEFFYLIIYSKYLVNATYKFKIINNLTKYNNQKRKNYSFLIKYQNNLNWFA